MRGFLRVQGLDNPTHIGKSKSPSSNVIIFKDKKTTSKGGKAFRGKNELRRERNERRAKFRDGEALLPLPVVRFDSSVHVATKIRHSIVPHLFFSEQVSSIPTAQNNIDMKLEAVPTVLQKMPLENRSNMQFEKVSSAKSSECNQICLEFRMPVSPSRPQLVTMKAAVRAINHNAIGFLESPTGTGKTLGLMVAALECQRAIEEKLSLERQKNQREQIIKDQENEGEEEEKERQAAPRVVWVARTHDQLEHAVHEFKRLPYRPMMSLRLSRERYCAHPDVAVAPNRAEACEEERVAALHEGEHTASCSAARTLDR